MALSSINLADLNGDNGFIINGAEDFDYSGTSVSSAGDINGDGIDDLIIGAPHSVALPVWTGESYIIFGSSNGFNANFDLENIDGNNGFVIEGAVGGYNSGISVSRAGDINNDGIEDLIIGAPASYSLPGFLLIAPGDSYVLFGSKEDFGSNFDLENLDGNNGFRIRGIEAGDFAGISVSNAGDVNGDDIDDLIVGASLKTVNDRDSTGESYIVYGSADGFDAELELENLDGNNGFTIRGIAEDDNLGTSVSNAGDINGDGIDDMLIAAPDADRNDLEDAGEVYLVFGSEDGFDPILNLANLDGDNGFVIPGIVAGDRVGGSLSNAGDVNGDGIEDLIVGAPSADVNGKENAGKAYVVFGKTEGFNASFDLENLDGNNGFVVLGINAGDNLGSSVSTAGDVNDDGIDDLIIGADDADPNNEDGAGVTYVLFGQAGGFDAVVDLETIDSNKGFALNGIAADDKSGVSVSDAGDINGDGIDDVVIGAWQSNSNGTQSGQSYVVFGVGEANGNSPPILEREIVDRSFTSGQTFNFTLPANTFTDPDAGDTLSYSATLADNNPLPDWLTFNAENRTFSGTPTNADVGNLEIKVTATDSQGESATDTFILTVVDRIVTDLVFASLDNDRFDVPNSTNQWILFAGAGEDEINAASANPNLNDRLYTASGDDLIIAGSRDRSFGGDGNDTLDASSGGGGNRLYGGAGNDRLIAGSNDVLFGGVGEDEFILADGSLPSAVNIVGDFEDGIDRILINNLDLSEDNISITEGIIAIDGQNIAQLLGVDDSLLTIDDSNANSISIG